MLFGHIKENWPSKQKWLDQRFGFGIKNFWGFSIFWGFSAKLHVLYENGQISYINLYKGCKRQTMWLRINWFHVEQQRNRSGIHFGRCRCFNCQSVQSSGFRRICQFHIRFISLKTIFIFITFYIGFKWNIFNFFNTVKFSIFFFILIALGYHKTKLFEFDLNLKKRFFRHFLIFGTLYYMGYTVYVAYTVRYSIYGMYSLYHIPYCMVVYGMAHIKSSILSYKMVKLLSTIFTFWTSWSYLSKWL